ncbi:acyltransferase family protein [Nocardioides sp.]|uniref:acyltransferase family protein n=1 Tax=Nocardioides sp. TaxID=35761 RepID=UPI003517222F
MRSPVLPRPDASSAASGRRREAPRASSTRGDIQGLRAVAVGLVIANHVFDVPTGGFVGVDIFFVLSGFLITDLLLREHHREGRISYLDFYRRRVRRIVPVATLVLAVTIASTYLLYSGVRGKEVATDGLWAFGFVANWRFADVGTDYFASGGPVSPLQHYWSLSVEEQFYVVWPTLLVLTLAAAALIGGRRLRTPLVTAVVLIVGGASFVYSLAHTVDSPTVAYFSTLDRAWELLVGALIAVTAGAWSRLPDLLRPVLAYAGLAAIVASVALIGEGDPFPAPWAALPVFGTAAVVAAGVGRESRLLWPLQNRVARYLGDISYSLYLWHFPLVILLLAYFPDGGLTYQVVALASTLVLSVFSYHMVENPIRHSSWLEPRWKRVLHNGPANHSHRLANTWLAIGAVVAVVLSAAAVAAPESDTADQQLLTAAPATTEPGQTTVDDPQQQYLTERITQTLQLNKFPTLTPSADQLGIQQWFADMEDYGCVAVVEANYGDCSFGDAAAKSTTVVFGDSIAIAWMPAVREALSDVSRIQQLTLQECPPFDIVTNKFSGGAFPECQAFRPWAVGQIEDLDPDLVIMSSTILYAFGALSDGATGPAALDEISAGLKRTLQQISAPGRTIVFLSAPPGAGDLSACATKVGSPDDCELQVPQEWYQYNDTVRDVVEAAGGVFVDTRDWFCVDDFCPGFIGTTPAFVDGEHLTVQYSKQLGPVLRETLRADLGAAEGAGDKGGQGGKGGKGRRG